MTQVRVITRECYTLVYDTDDVENINVHTQHDSTETDGPNGTTRHELTGYSHLDLHIDFKHGKHALWVKDEELGGDGVRAEPESPALP